MTNNQLRPQKAKKGTAPKAKEQNASGGGTYDMSAGPTSVSPTPPPGQPDQAQGVPGGPSARKPARVPKGSASYSGPESKRPPKAPAKGDRGVA